MEKYSVLMSVYNKEKAKFLEQSMKSMFNQTIIPNEFVLVCDGPLSDELNKIIDKFNKQYKNILKVIRLEKNVGLGCALKEGIEHCTNEFIARMDSDDISKKDRCEKQLEIFKKNPKIGIVGSNIEEFSTDVNIINSIRQVPEENDDIKRFLKKRNPFNHPSVMYKKSDVLRAGNYKNVRYMQDYFLWVDMLSNGVVGYNIQENLVSMRADNNLFKRRSGKQYLKIQKQLLKYMKEKKMINIFEFFIFLIVRTISSLLPNSIRKIIFKKILRKGV